MEHSRHRVLIVDDDHSVRRVVRLHLERQGYTADEAVDGAAAIRSIRRNVYDVILLDVALPRVDGLAVCRSIRAEGMNLDTPVIMLSARPSESDKVLGFESGADDYLTKPFGVRELTARINAILRREDRLRARAAAETRTQISAGQITLDLQTRIASVRGVAVDLTRQEFDVLACLMTHRGRVYSRGALLRSMWNGDAYVTERTVDTLVSRLRKKVERDPHQPRLIQTVWGVGYKFEG